VDQLPLFIKNNKNQEPTFLREIENSDKHTLAKTKKLKFSTEEGHLGDHWMFTHTRTFFIMILTTNGY
jgi:hypothetical protein